MHVLRAVRASLAEDFALVPMLSAIFAFNLGSAAWSAVVAMAVYVGMPALVIGASRPGRDGWALALLGLAGGAGGALGPWTGSTLADMFGLWPVLLLFAFGAAVMLPCAT